MIGIEIVDMVMAHKYLTDIDRDGEVDLDDAKVVAILVEERLAEMGNYTNYITAEDTVEDLVDYYVKVRA